MNSKTAAERRLADATSKPIPQEIDRFEDEGGPGPVDTRQQLLDDAPDVRPEVAQAELSVPVACPKCDGQYIRTQEAAGAADPSKVIITAGATANTVQVHHHGIPELRSHGESPQAAAANLVQVLTRELDGAVDDLHREPLQQALDDVKASTERGA